MATTRKNFAVDNEFDLSKIDILWSGTWEEAPAWNVKDSKYALCLPVPVKTVRDWKTSASGESRMEHVIVWQMDLQEILSDGKVYHVGYVRQKYGFRDPNPTLEFGMGATAVKASAMTSEQKPDDDPTLALHPRAPPSSPIATPPADTVPVPAPRASRKRSYHIDPDDSDDEAEVRARKRRIAAGTSTVSDDIADVYFEAKQHEPFIRMEDCGMVTYKVRRKCKKIPPPPAPRRIPTVTARCDVLEYIPIRAELVCQ
ncbi:hypothetical protein EXIGLDRAFT_841143 [Exidia glandulosa HHB12029]|uniref:Uncharacterized protein n=1 Tax=Exidia glandulosa HHB12029 TaxID=1314781 RepID=A0A165E2G4_EXIGL|nr:hypothetical protein EXIGLDRAFT_841143 [Exidia glandulosa HHB12029]